MMKIDNWATCLSRYCHWFVSFGSNKSIQSWGRTEATSNNSKAKGLVTPFTRVIFRLRDSSPLVHNTMNMYPSFISDTFVYQNYSFSDTFVYHNTMYMYPSFFLLSFFFFILKKKNYSSFIFFFFFLHSSISEFLMCIVVLVQDSKGADSESFSPIRFSVYEKTLNLIPIHDSSKIILTQLAGWFEKLSVIKSLLNHR